MKIRYFEIMFPDGYSMIIKAVREPGIAEAERFLSEDMKNLGYDRISYIEEWTEADARTAFDFENEKSWPVFGE